MIVNLGNNVTIEERYYNNVFYYDIAIGEWIENERAK
jgi:hypothetical protein